jgi:hypothetical protein
LFIAIFAFFAILKYLPTSLQLLCKSTITKDSKQVMSITLLIFLICISLFWIYFTNLHPFLIDIHNEAYLITSQITQVSGQISSTTPTSSWFFNNPAGPFVGFWLDFTLVLVPIGLLLLFFKFKKDSTQTFWVFAGLTMMLFVAIWVLAGNAMLGVYLDRVLVMGFPFFATFIASSLLMLPHFFRKRRLIKICAIAIPFLFLATNLPMNMVIPSYQRYVLYMPRDNVFPTVSINQYIIGENEFAMSAWLAGHSSQNTTYWTDFANQWFYCINNVTIDYDQTVPVNSTATYFLLDHYNLLGMWRGPTDTLFFSSDQLLKNCSVIYSNGDSALIAKLDKR